MTQAPPNSLNGKKRSTGIVGENPMDIESFFYNLGHDLTAGSLEFAAGVVVGGFEVLGKMTGKLVFGAIETLKNTRNVIVRNKGQAAVVSAAFDKMSLNDIDRLAKGRKLDDNATQQIANFIETIDRDGLNGYDVKNDRAEIALGNYVFNRAVVNDSISYQVLAADSNEPIVRFLVNENGEISVTPSKAQAARRELLMNFVNDIGDKFNIDLQTKNLNEINDSNLQQNIARLQTELSELGESVDNVEMSTSDTRAQSRLKREELLEQRSQLYQLEDRANIIRSIIVEKSIALASEVARNPNAQNKGVDTELAILTSKLEGIVESIDNIETKIAAKETALNSIGLTEAGATVQSEIAAGIAARAKVNVSNNVVSTQSRIEQSLPNLKNSSKPKVNVPQNSQISKAEAARLNASEREREAKYLEAVAAAKENEPFENRNIGYREQLSLAVAAAVAAREIANIAIAAAETANISEAANPTTMQGVDPYSMTFSEEPDYSEYESTTSAPTPTVTKNRTVVPVTSMPDNQSSVNSAQSQLAQ